MPWLAVSKDGTEYICRCMMIRERTYWVDSDPIESFHNSYDTSFELPKGSIKKLIGRSLTWEDEPVELKDE